MVVFAAIPFNLGIRILFLPYIWYIFTVIILQTATLSSWINIIHVSFIRIFSSCFHGLGCFLFQLHHITCQHIISCWLKQFSCLFNWCSEKKGCAIFVSTTLIKAAISFGHFFLVFFSLVFEMVRHLDFDHID